MADHIGIEEAILACWTAALKRGIFAAFYTDVTFKPVVQ